MRKKGTWHWEKRYPAFLDVDYAPNERFALIVDILAEGVVALSAAMNFLEASERIKIRDLATLKIVYL
ncbi:MAG: hypothetical protein EXS63_08630 [Candidatus Omnitrophica bacterium]|nr:hypothetical protein [Candidatus Omnitrophota bacterium]